MNLDIILLPVVIPGAAGVIALFLPARLRAVVGFLGALAALGTGLMLIGTREEYTQPWVSLGPLNLDFALRVEGYTGWLAAFAGLFAFLVVLYSTDFFRGKGGAPGRFYAYLLLATAGTEGVILASNLLFLLFCWEVVTLMLFFLVATGHKEGPGAAAKAFAILGFGDVALILAIVLLGVVHRGALNPMSFSTLEAAPVATTGFVGIAAYVLLFAAAAAKAGAMPLHSWIPTMASASSPPVMAILPASLDKVLGIYLLARASLDFCAPTDWVRFAVMAVGVITILAAVLMAMLQHDVKKLLSFHAVSQVGYMVLGIGTGTVIGILGGLFHMLNNAIYKACLFLGAGAVEREAGTGRLDRLGGLFRAMPTTFLCMLVAALAISGVPPLNGFASKWLVYQGCVAAGQPLFLVAALFGSVLTLASFVKVMHSMFWGPLPPALDNVREAGLGMRIPLVVLAVLCVLFGVLPGMVLDDVLGPAVPVSASVAGANALAGQPAAFMSVDPAIAAALPPPSASPGTFRPGVVVALLLIGIVAGLLVAHTGGARQRRVRSVFIGGEPLDREVNRFPGTEFYRTIHEMPALGRALAQGEKGSFDVYRIFGAVGSGVVWILRRLHRGIVTDYLAWALLGLVVILLVFWG